MKIAWATDIHLDFITSPGDLVASARNLDIFCQQIEKGNPESVILTGDISVSKFLKDHLIYIESKLRRPIYFVLGNHDFWGSTFEKVRKDCTDLSKSSEYLRYASCLPYVELTPRTALIGHDGWYDGYNGDPNGSNVVMNDWLRIGEFVRENCVVASSSAQSRNMNSILAISREQSNAAAAHLVRSIKSVVAQKKYRTVIVLTHVPPFVEAHYHKGSPGDPAMHPWYTSRTMGSMLLSAAKSNPDIRFEVFCGHTHGKFSLQVTENLFCHVGGSEYSNPDTQGTFDIP